MDNENIPTTPAPEAPETTPAEEPIAVDAPAAEAPVAEAPAPEAPVVAPAEEAPVEAPAPEAPVTEAPVAAPAKKSNKAAIIATCCILGVVAIASTVAIILINNKNNEEAKKDAEVELANIELAKQFGEDLPIDDYDEQGYEYSANPSTNPNPDTNSSTSIKTSTKCSSAEECIMNLDNTEGTTVADYNQAIGFDGTLDSSASTYSKTYVWKFSNGDKLTAKFSDYSDVDLEVDYEYSAHTSDVNLNGYDTVSDRIEDGITYAELKAALGGVDGLLSRRSSYGTKEYLWVGSTSTRYIEATVNEKGLVTFVSGRK